MDLNFLIIGTYLVVIFLIGIVAGRQVKDFNDYILASSKFGVVLLGATVIATAWGGVTFLGIAGFAYDNLYQGVWYALGPSIRFLFWAFLLAVVLKKVAPYTVSEWFAVRYDSKCGVVSSILNVVTGLGLLGAQFVAFGAITATFMGWDLNTSIIVGAVIVIIYTTAGGFFSVTITDAVQLILAVLGGVLVLVAAVSNYGTLGSLRQELPTAYFDPVEPWGFIFMLTVFMLWLADLPLQHNVQRMVGAINVRTAYWVAILGGVSYLIILYISPAVGAYARFAVPNVENPDQAYPTLVMAMLPEALAAVVAAALLAVVMSSASSYILGPASLIANDLYRVWRTNPSNTEAVWVSRVFTLVFSLMGLYAALSFQVIIELILTFLVVSWALLPAYFASTMWRRASRNAAFWSMLIGAGTNAYLITFTPNAFAEYPPYYTGWIGFAIALLILVVGSYVSPERRFDTPHEPSYYRRALAELPPQ